MSTGLPSPPRTPTGTPETPGAGQTARAVPGEPRRRRSASPRGRWSPSPTFGRAELLWAVLGGVALALITTWPLVLHMSSRIEPDLGDPVRTAWEVAWVGHAMLNQPLHLFDANVFYPHPLSLAFSDSLLGYGPAAWFGSGTVAALVRYNLLFLFAWSLCFTGAYLLVRELGVGRLGAAAAGAAFAYAPYRVTEAGHLHVISSGGLALALFLLLRGYRRGQRWLVLAGWLVSAWQVSLGFTLGLQYCYLLGILAVIAAVYWWRGELHHADAPQPEHAAPALEGGDGAQGEPAAASARGPLIPRRLLAVTVLGVAVLGVVSIYQARPYLKVANDYPSARRTLKEVKTYSSGPAALLAASSENRVWGGLTSGLRAKVHSKNESIFFPGGLILVLALIGLVGVGGSRAGPSGAGGSEADAPEADAPEAVAHAGGHPLTGRLRLGLALGILTCSILALGLGLTGAGYPYRLVHDYAPGWDGVRVPGRIFTLATLFYAVLVGAGAQLLVRRIGPWGARHSLRGLPALLGVVLVIGIVGEGAGHLEDPVVPQPARAEIGLPGPILDLPTDGAADRLWQYFSTDGFYKIPQGNSTFDVHSVDDLRGGMNGFPDRASVEKLRYYGIRTVVLHLRMPRLPGIVGYAIAEPPNTAAAAEKPVAGLGVTRRRVGSIVIYEIGPGPKALHGTN
jgi:hypothetical protein